MSSADLSESERKFLENAMTCLKSPPELDTPKLAEKLGIKPKSVTNKWWEIKKKLWGTASHAATVTTPTKGGAGEDDDASPAPASTGGKRKHAAADAGEGDTPKARKARAKKEPSATPKAAKGKNAKVKSKPKVESDDEDKKEGIVDSDDTEAGEE